MTGVKFTITILSSMIRKAVIADAKAIYELLGYWAKKGVLLERSLNYVYEHIRDFWVYQNSEKIIGCCALHVIGWEGLAEIKSLAVHPASQHRGIGSRLVKKCIREGKSLGLTTVFSLTFVDGFFKRLGFSETDKRKLPHKIWSDCINCAAFPDCNEIAVIRSIS